MCWEKVSKKEPEYVIAREPIKVYKIMKNNSWPCKLKWWQRLINVITPMYALSYYWNYVYKKNTLQPKIEITKIDKCGLLKSDEYLWTICEGYHSYFYLSTSLLNEYKDCIIAECEIPAGTKYYIHRNEIVSEQIIVKKIKK